ncbi:MAG: hypothetical protein M1550_06855 [Deltaproteobacteria bacterium]|nr:hypothetical protein [Deltaproteobacteria bacterium]
MSARRLDQQILKLSDLVSAICEDHIGAEHPFGDGRTVDNIRHGQDVFPGFRGKAKKAHDLGHACPGDSLPPGDVGLVSDRPGVELAPPLDGLAEEFGLRFPRVSGTTLTT